MIRKDEHLADSVNRLADALDEHERRAVRQERAERDRARERRMTEGPVPTRAGKEYDSVGLVPSRLDALTFTRAIPGYIERFDKRVPPEMTALVDEDEVEVACPCGDSHRVVHRIPTSGACGRHFIYDGREVRVASPA